MGAGRRGARRAPAASLGAALGAALAAGAALGAWAGAGHHPTPAGYAELPDPAECKVGCETLTMSGLELLRHWQRRPEGGRQRWFEAGSPLQKKVVTLGACHEGVKVHGSLDRTRVFDLADAIFKHLGALEDTVEAEHALKTGVPVAEVSRADKHKRLLEAYLKEPTLKHNGMELALDPQFHENQIEADAATMKVLHVNTYHEVTGLLQWPFMDYRSTPRLGKMADYVQKQRETCKSDTLPIYYISLVRRKDRRKSVVAAMENNAPFSFVDAVDGRGGGVDMGAVHVNPHMKIDDPRDPRYFLVPGTLMQYLEAPVLHSKKYWGRKINKGEVGLILSLKRAFEKALGEGHKSVLILEDDHVLVDTKSYPNSYCIFLEAVQELHESGIEYDFIQIESYNWYGDDVSKIPEEGMNPYFVPLSTSYSTHAVLWHERGMRKMLASGYFERCVMVIDEYLSYMTNPGRHPRADFHDCYGEDGMPPAPEKHLKGLRWRGRRFLRDNIGQEESSIDGEF